MQLAVQPTLSDQHQGGVTRVISVQYSEVTEGSTGGVGAGGGGAAAGAPKAESLASEEERIQQIRLASKAQELQMQYMKELNGMDEVKRQSFLDRAKQVSDDFLRTVMELPPGQERVEYLRTVDPETSKLMTMYKLWITTQAVHK